MKNISSSSSQMLLAQTKKLVGDERDTLAQFLAHLAEIDARKIYVDEGFSSLFSFLTRGLKMSEGCAVKRVRVARLGRQHSHVLAMIGSGDVHLSAASMLFEHRDHHDFATLLSGCIHKSSREVEEFLAKTFARPGPIRESIRLIAAPKSKCVVEVENVPVIDQSAATSPVGSELFSETSPSPGPGQMEPEDDLAARIAVTITKVDLERLNRLKQLSPGDNMARIFGDAIAALLEQRDPDVRFKKKEKTAAKTSPTVTMPKSPKTPLNAKKATRYIPKNVRREVYNRDGGCCTFAAVNGQRCTERGRLEFDHIVPFALAGANNADNLRLRCKAHNLHHAQSVFERSFMQAKMAKALF